MDGWDLFTLGWAFHQMSTTAFALSTSIAIPLQPLLIRLLLDSSMILLEEKSCQSLRRKRRRSFLPAAPGSRSSLAKAESLGNFTVVWVVGRGRRSIDDIWMEVTQYTSKSSTAMMQTSFQFPTFHCFLWYVNSPPHHQTFPRPSYIFSTSFCWVMMLPFIDS